MKLNWFIGCLLIVFSACQNNSNSQAQTVKTDTMPVSAETKSQPQTQSNIPVNAKWSRFCELLSGDTSVLKPNDINAPIWKNYARETNIKWSILNNRVVKPISNWVQNSKLET